MRKRNFLAVVTTAGLAGVFALACSEQPTGVDGRLPDLRTPQFGETSPSNDFGACMGNDILSYNAIAAPNEKSSWSNTPIPNGNFCTSNDIYLATANVYEVFDEGVGDFVPVTGPITCVEGDLLRIKVNAQLGQNAASARSDIGVWIAQIDPNADPMPPPPTQAVDGTCNHYNLIPGVDGALDLDGGDDCGDMESAAGELLDLDLEELVLTCTPNENQKVELPSCIGWTVPGGDRICPFAGDDPINFRMGTVPVNTSKCNCENFELDIVVLEMAHLEVRKELDPTDDAGVFDLFIDEGTADEISATDQGHNGSTGRQEVGAGTSADPGATHTFSEGAGTGTSLSDYETTWECRDVGGTEGDRGSGTGAGPENITLQPDDDVVCTFTNARKPEVRVEKEFDPTDDTGLVEFDVGGNSDDNSGAGYGHGGITQFYQFDIGDDVSFSETAFGSTDLGDYESSWECDNTESGTGTSGSTGTLAAGDQVTCTFTNAAKPVVKLVKDFSPDTDPGLVEFTIEGTDDDNSGAGYGDDGETDWYQFDIGTDVDFSETGFGTTDLGEYSSSWACDNGEDGTGTSGSTGALAAGDSITCTFTNAKNPVVKLVKEFDPTDDGGLVSFNVGGNADDNGTAGYGHGGETQFYEFDVGDDVSFSEAGFSGTDLGDYESSWECDNGESGTGTSGTTGALASGDQVTCTFTNARKPEVRVEKEFDPTDDSGLVSFNVGGNADDNGTAGYGHGGITQFYQFDIGDDVSFSEAGFSGTDLGDYESSWECDNTESGTGTSGSTGALAAGDQVTCTFTNARKPEVKVVKQFDPDDAGTVNFTIDGVLFNNSGAGYGDGQGTDFITVDIGDNVAFSEAGNSINLANYTSVWSCDNGAGGTGTAGTSGSTGVLAAGDQVTCTFVNTIIPQTCEQGDRVTSVTLEVISASPDPLRIQVHDQNGPNPAVIEDVNPATVGTVFTVVPAGGDTFFDSQNLRFSLGEVGGSTSIAKGLTVHLSCSDDPEVGDLHSGSVGDFSVTLRKNAFQTTQFSGN